MFWDLFRFILIYVEFCDTDLHVILTLFKFMRAEFYLLYGVLKTVLEQL